MTARDGVRVAVAACVAALVLVGLAGARALAIAPSPGGPPVVMDATRGERAVGPSPLETARLYRAAARNPFHPERRRGGVFRLPDEAAPTIERGLSAPAVEGPLRLIGTAVTGGERDFVVCGVGREAPRIVRVGGRCGELVLVRVEPGRAEFRSPAGDPVVLEVPKAGDT